LNDYFLKSFLNYHILTRARSDKKKNCQVLT